MKIQKQQSGMTLISGLIAGLIFLGIIILGFKLIPPYIENYMIMSSIRNIADNLKKESDYSFDEYRREIMTKFDNHLNINGFSSVKRDYLTINQTPQGIDVGLTYDVNINIVGNMDAIIHFNNKIEIQRH